MARLCSKCDSIFTVEIYKDQNSALWGSLQAVHEALISGCALCQDVRRGLLKLGVNLKAGEGSYLGYRRSKDMISFYTGSRYDKELNYQLGTSVGKALDFLKLFSIAHTHR
jgi:hypothetical protein